MPVKPFTLMGEGMLVTVGALMPGGVLPPAATRGRQAKTERNSQLWVFFPPKTLWRSFASTGHLVSLGNVRGAGPVGQ